MIYGADLSRFVDGDSYIYSTFADRNFGTSATLNVSSAQRPILWVDAVVWDDIGAGQVITACGCSLSSTVDPTYDTLLVKGLWKYDIEEGTGGAGGTDNAGVSWNDFNNTSDYQWGTAGALSADNIATGTFNITDAGGDDRTTETIGAIIVTASGWFVASLDTAFCNKAYTNDVDLGIIIADSGANISASFRSIQTTGTTVDPRFYFTHEAASAGGKKVLIKR